MITLILLKCTALSLHFKGFFPLLPYILTTLFHRFDVLCFGWDAQHERQIARLIDQGIDAVYGDYVDRLVAVEATFH